MNRGGRPDPDLGLEPDVHGCCHFDGVTGASAGPSITRTKRFVTCTGFVEGATMTPDNHAIYFHKLEEKLHVIYRAERKLRG